MRWRSAPTGARWPRHRRWRRPAVDVSAPARPRLLGPILTGGGGSIFVGGVSPDRHTLASGNFDGTSGLWDVSDPAQPRLLSPILTGSSSAIDTGSSAIDSVALSPDGRMLASGSLDGTVAAVGCRRSRARPIVGPDPGHWQLPRRLGGVQPWRAHAGRRQPATARSGCGISPTPRTPARWSPILTSGTAAIYTRRVQPRWAHAGRRQRRRHGPVVGCHRSRAAPPARPDPDRRRRA